MPRLGGSAAAANKLLISGVLTLFSLKKGPRIELKRRLWDRAGQDRSWRVDDIISQCQPNHHKKTPANQAYLFASACQSVHVHVCVCVCGCVGVCGV